jgi:hypothetical protein
MKNYSVLSNSENLYQKKILLKQIQFSLSVIYDCLINEPITRNSLHKEDVENFYSHIEYLNNLSFQSHEFSTYNILEGLFDLANKKQAQQKYSSQVLDYGIKNDMLELFLDYFKTNKQAIGSSMDSSFCYTLSYISKCSDINYIIAKTLMSHTEWRRDEMVEFLNNLTVSSSEKSIELLKKLIELPSFSVLTENDLSHFIQGFIKHSLTFEDKPLNYSDVVLSFEKNGKIAPTHILSNLSQILPKKLIEKALLDVSFNAAFFAPEINLETISINTKFGVDKFINYMRLHSNQFDNSTFTRLFFNQGLDSFFKQAIATIQDNEVHNFNELKFVGKIINYLKLYNNVATALNFDNFTLSIDNNLKNIIQNKLDAISIIEKINFDNNYLNNQNQNNSKKTRKI